MEICKLSFQYKVRRLNEMDKDAIFNLSKDNPVFYKYCPPYVTKESILCDMQALPPNTNKSNKFYLGYFEGDKLIAIIDLILKYPNEKTAFIGLFMIHKDCQNQGIGSNIINDCVQYLKTLTFSNIRLAYAKGNMQSESFWLKNHFIKTGEESKNKDYTAIIMQRKI